MRDKSKPAEKKIKGLQIRMAPDKNIKEDISNWMGISELK